MRSLFKEMYLYSIRTKNGGGEMTLARTHTQEQITTE